MRPAAVTASFGAVLTLTAAAFDAEPLYVPGTAFLLVAGIAVAWVWGSARGLRISRTVGAQSVVEDDPVDIAIEVRSGPLGLPAGAIADDLLDELAPLAAARRTTRLHISARFARRGRRTLAPPRVLVADPLGLALREVAAAEPAELLVLPRVHAVRGPDGGASGEHAVVHRGRPWVAAEIDLDGVRPHRTGAPASRIVWPVFARTGELIERQLRADTDTRPLVVLDPRGAASEDDLDAAVRATASLAVHLARAGGCALLLPGDRRPVPLGSTLAGWERLHARLALVDGATPPALGALGTRRGPVLYVSARRDARPPRALATAPGGGRLLVVPGAPSTRRAAFTVAGCTGYELSEPARRRGAA